MLNSFCAATKINRIGRLFIGKAARFSDGAKLRRSLKYRVTNRIDVDTIPGGFSWRQEKPSDIVSTWRK